MTQDSPLPTDHTWRELCVAGELDLDTVPDLEQRGLQALTDPSVLTLALNLASVTFIDSTGIGVLVRLRLAADEHLKRFVLRRPSEPVRRLLTITALTAAFTLDDTATTTQT